jgi:hypothetical protein
MSTISAILILSASDYGLGYVFLPFLIWLLVCAGGLAPLVLLRYANFSPVEQPIPIFEKVLSVLDPSWIEENGFQVKYAIRPLGVPMAIFVNLDQTIALVAFGGGLQIVDLVSNFPAGISLTTSTTIDGPVIPNPPGVMFQTCRDCDLQSLLQIHQDGLGFLRRHLQTEIVCHQDVAISMQQFVRRQLNHLLLRPWNILALPYRWAITRFARMNLTLEQQEQKGIIDLQSLLRQSRAAA